MAFQSRKTKAAIEAQQEAAARQAEEDLRVALAKRPITVQPRSGNVVRVHFESAPWETMASGQGATGTVGTANTASGVSNASQSESQESSA